MPSTTIRQTVLCKARRLVIKVGSQLLAKPEGGLDTRYMGRLAAQMADLMDRGYELTLVSSGAIAMGRMMLGMKRRPKDVATLQAVAAVGQSGLMRAWHQAFAKRDREVGQILLTRNGFEDRHRYLHTRNCITELHRIGAVPIVNENDTVAVEEIRFGDNDLIAALVSSSLGTDALILLTVVEGLKDGTDQVVDLVDDLGTVRSMVHAGRSAMGSGGMETKLEAARLATDAGAVAVIAGGRERNVLTRLLAGEKIGTVFVPATRKLAPRQRWIVQAVRPNGSVTIDDGAADALLHKGKSLLAIGVTEIVGRFEAGDVVQIRNRLGHEVARGLINCDAEETRKIMGLKSADQEQKIGRMAYDELIHRDNLVITKKD